MKPLCRLLALAAALASPSARAAEPLPAAAPMPTARDGAGVALVDGSLYVLGGEVDGRILDVVERYDASKDRWTRLAPMPLPNRFFGTAVVGAKIYVIGGERPDSYLETVDVFDAATGRWSAGPPLERRASHVAAVSLGSRIYAVGGATDVGSGPVSDVSVLDTRTNEWRAAPPMITPRNYPGIAAGGGRIWVVGGVGSGRALSSVESLDAATGSWRSEPDLPWAGANQAAFVAGRLYAYGGSDGSRSDISSMAFLRGGAWVTAAHMPTGRSSFGSASDGRRLFVVGGSPGMNIPLDSLEIYDARSKTWRTSARSLAPRVDQDEVDDPPPPRTPERPDNFALVIGLDDYRSVMASEFGKRDAEDFARYAVAKLGVPADNVITLTGERATRTDFVKYVEEWLPRNVEKDSRVYVYYSGHGAPDPEKGDSYLLPWDGDPMFLQSTGYPVARLYEKLAALPAKDVVVFLDSCFSGAGGRSVIAKNLRPLVHMKQTPVPGRGRLTVLTASGASQVAGGYEAERHGLFTYYLLKGLGGGEAGGEHLDVSQLYDYVRANVRREAHRENREQDPQLQTSEPGLRLY